MQNESQRHKDKDGCNDKDAGRLLYKNIFISHFMQGVEKVVWGFTVRGSWRPNINCYILTPILWPATLGLSLSSGAQPEPWSPLCWVLAFFTASYQHLLWTPTHQGPNGLFGLMWLSLPHLVSNCLQLHWLVELNCLLPGSFDAHSIFEIECLIVIKRKLLSCSSEVTLFQCITLKWDLHLVPSHQPSTPARFFSIIGHWNVSVPSGASPWNSILGPGRRSKYYIGRL